MAIINATETEFWKLSESNTNFKIFMASDINIEKIGIYTSIPLSFDIDIIDNIEFSRRIILYYLISA